MRSAAGCVTRPAAPVTSSSPPSSTAAHFALWKNADNLTERQKLKLASIQQINKRLYRAYVLSQQLRQIYRVAAKDALRKLARRITEQRDSVEAAFTNNLSKAGSARATPALR
jgi:transposase